MDKKVNVSDTQIRITLHSAESVVRDISVISIGNPVRGIQAKLSIIKNEAGEETGIAEYIFDKTKWTTEEAVKWVEDHEGVRLERSISYAAIKGIDVETQSADFYGSTGVVDRDGEILTPDAFNNEFLQRWIDNPVVLWAHDYQSYGSDTPKIVGRGENVRFDEMGMKFKTVFQTVTQFGKDVWELTKGGFLKATSVGFIPKAWREATKQEMQKFGENIHRVIYKAELLEISIVPVPSNYAATMIADAKAFEKRDSIEPSNWLKILKAVEQEQANSAEAFAASVAQLKKDIGALTGKVESRNIRTELAALAVKLDRMAA